MPAINLLAIVGNPAEARHNNGATNSLPAGRPAGKHLNQTPLGQVMSSSFRLARKRPFVPATPLFARLIYCGRRWQHSRGRLSTCLGRPEVGSASPARRARQAAAFIFCRNQARSGRAAANRSETTIRADHHHARRGFVKSAGRAKNLRPPRLSLWRSGGA